jgi:hypothetical protein
MHNFTECDVWNLQTEIQKLLLRTNEIGFQNYKEYQKIYKIPKGRVEVFYPFLLIWMFSFVISFQF